MLSKELEFSLNQIFAYARNKNHEFMTVEHLLYAVLDNPSAIQVLRFCGGDVERLKLEVGEFIEETTPRLQSGETRECQPTLGFQRVLQRAVFHVQSSDKNEVAGADVLVALFSESESQAVYFLNKSKITRQCVLAYVKEQREGHEQSTQRKSYENEEYYSEYGIDVDIRPMSIYIESSSINPSELASLFVEISSLYRMLGGSGLTFQYFDSKEVEEVTV